MSHAGRAVPGMRRMLGQPEWRVPRASTLTWQKQTVSRRHGKQTHGWCQAGVGQAVPTTPVVPAAGTASPAAGTWVARVRVLLLRGNQPAVGSSLTEVKGTFSRRLQLPRALLLQYLASTAERNNKLDPGFG